MVFPLFRRPARPDTISTLYGMIVAQARLPIFYQEYGVSDTVNGRFDLLVLHLAAVSDRLFAEPALKELGQGLFDRFCQDMDGNLREIGIADLKVPKEMRRIGEAFYGRAMAYREALAADDAALAAVIVRNVYGEAAAPAGVAPALAVYMRDMVADLAGQEAGALAAGTLRLPDPTKYLKIEG